jgi:NAD(P)-dependent dehydrogenase (short-subunit alcohol dehydrogenase family)
MVDDDDTTGPPSAHPTTSDGFAHKLEHTLAFLESLASDHAQLVDVDIATRIRLQTLCGQVAKPDMKARKKLQKAQAMAERGARRVADLGLRQDAGIQKLRQEPVFITPPLLMSGPAINDAVDDGRADIDDARGDLIELVDGADVAGADVDGADVDDGDDQGNGPGPARHLHDARVCYVCKQRYTGLHHFYDQLCVPCGDENFAKREPRFDLRGKVALLTGARVKIGYHAAIMLLRNGCRVVVTTRFPADAAARFAAEKDAADWLPRLSVWGLDLRHTPSVDAVARHLASTLGRLDFIIHNACQTVRRPPGFYAHLMEAETSLASLPVAARPSLEAWQTFVDEDHSAKGALLSGVARSAALSQVGHDVDSRGLLGAMSESTLQSIFPVGLLDADLQQIDLRQHNSWRSTLGDVPVVELLEVMLVNAAAPFVLTSKLLPLLKHDNVGRDRHVVNVSAMEGQFYRRRKTEKHPHTNMAKAALNMMTRTSAQECAPHGIWMNAVDTGWITDEDPAQIAARKAVDHAFSPPLDIVDGAARIVDPIFAGLGSGTHAWGIFFKNYRAAPW